MHSVEISLLPQREEADAQLKGAQNDGDDDLGRYLRLGHLTLLGVSVGIRTDVANQETLSGLRSLVDLNEARKQDDKIWRYLSEDLSL